jgi:hypothetical protein
MSVSERAREMLAAEYEAGGFRDRARSVLGRAARYPNDLCALRALETALSNREAVIEECARVAERHGADAHPAERVFRNEHRENIAAAIRNLNKEGQDA